MTRAFTSIVFDRPPHLSDRPGRSLLVILSTIVVLTSAIGGYLGERPGAGSGSIALSVHTEYYQNGPGAFVPGWSNITPTAGGDDAFPQARQQPGMTYDTGLDGIILYGGTGGSGQILNDTWLQVSGELEWNTPIFAPTVHEFPPGLSHTALAYDPQDDQLILFGGDLASGSAYGGTWGFAGDSWVNFTWTNFTSPTGPGPVATPAMAYDPTVNGILLYTGSNGSSTWIFQNGTWSSVTVASGPPARSDGAIVYDPYEGGVVLFGGRSAGATPSSLNDTWLFKNGTWRQLDLAHAPPPLFSPSMTYDTRMGAALLVGGGSSVQTWALTNGTWANQSSISTQTPSGRTGFGIAYDAGDDWVMLFGGDHWTGWPPILDDIWGWDYPATAPNDQLVAAALPTQIWEIAAFVVAVPIILAVLWVFWPRRRLPADSPFGVPSRARSRRAPVPEPPS
ncbi:MAG: kelch repeat-containing protein [Thermoplasmata archaeon]